MYIRMFDDRLVKLIEEIGQHHPALIARCNAQPDGDFYVQMGEVAAHCGILLDGDYTDKDIYDLCTVLTKRLVSMRTLVVVPDSLGADKEEDWSKILPGPETRLTPVHLIDDVNKPKESNDG